MTKKKVTQRQAMNEAFLNLCHQYQQMGKQLAVISTLIGPYLHGQQQITPEMTFEEGEDLIKPFTNSDMPPDPPPPV